MYDLLRYVTIHVLQDGKSKKSEAKHVVEKIPQNLGYVYVKPAEITKIWRLKTT